MRTSDCMLNYQVPAKLYGFSFDTRYIRPQIVCCILEEGWDTGSWRRTVQNNDTGLDRGSIEIRWGGGGGGKENLLITNWWPSQSWKYCLLRDGMSLYMYICIYTYVWGLNILAQGSISALLAARYISAISSFSKYTTRRRDARSNGSREIHHSLLVPIIKAEQHICHMPYSSEPV